MKYNEVNSIKDVRDWVRLYPNHLISSAWKDMLDQVDNYGENYQIEDFLEEAEYQVYKQAGSLSPDDIN